MTVTAASSLSRTPARSNKAASGRRRAVTLAGPALARDHAVLIGRRVMPCPFDGGPIQVEVNRRVDILASLRTQGAISEAAFQVGRMIQAVFERGSGARLGSAGWDISGSKDTTIAHELAILYSLEDAERIRKFSAQMALAIGTVGTRFLRAILAEGETFSGYAARTGWGSSEQAAREVAKRFRWLLQALTEEQHTATGAEGQRIRGTREPA